MTVTTTDRLRGEFRTLTKCRLCGGGDLNRFIDFGDVPLAGAFVHPERKAEERFYPMGMQFCRCCANVQVDTAIPADTLFKHYFYFSSAIQTLKDHFASFAEELSKDLVPKNGLVVEVGCNDGVFLRPIRERGLRCAGVDPATNVVATMKDSGIPVYNECFTKATAERIRVQHGAADAVVSSFSFAHIDDMHEVMRGIEHLLGPDGVFVFEIYYLGIVMQEMQYDMMYHEHMSYYTQHALERFLGRYGLELFDVRRITLRSGTLRFYARRKTSSKNPVRPSVGQQAETERSAGLLDEKTFQSFGARVHGTKTALLQVLDRYRKEGKRVIGYGASGRATTIMNYCGLDERYLDYVADDAPAKHGYLTPGTHIPVGPWPTEGPAPDAVLVFAWPFLEEVKRRRKDYLQNGGQFIIPLPDVRVEGA